MVPETGVEPVRNFVAADFKSATSTNSVIPAPKPLLRTLSGFPERTYEKRKPAASFSLEFWSGRRVSNSRPQPWQGCALPTELLPQMSGGARRNRTAVNGFAIRCIATLLSRHPGAGDESRTRDLNLGKVALYQLSYSRIRPAKDLNFTQFFGIGKSTLPKKTKNTINTVFEDPFSGVFRRFEAEERL